MNPVIVVIGAGSIGQAVARRVSTGKKVLLADLHAAHAEAAAKVMRDAGFDVATATVDVSSRPSVQALVEQAAARAKSSASSTRPASRPRRPRRRPSWPSTSTARRWCWRRSAT